MGKEWKALPEATKDSYKAKERKDRARYTKEQAAYLEKNPEMANNSSKKGSRSKNKNRIEGGPKRSTSAFFFFQADRRENLKKEKQALNHKQIVAVSVAFI